MKSCLLPFLQRFHIIGQIIAIIAALSFSGLLTFTIYFWDGSASGMAARMAVYAGGLIASVALFFFLLTLDFRPVVTPLSPSVPVRLTQPSEPQGEPSCRA